MAGYVEESRIHENAGRTIGLAWAQSREGRARSTSGEVAMYDAPLRCSKGADGRARP